MPDIPESDLAEMDKILSWHLDTEVRGQHKGKNSAINKREVCKNRGCEHNRCQLWAPKQIQIQQSPIMEAEKHCNRILPLQKMNICMPRHLMVLSLLFLPGEILIAFPQMICKVLKLEFPALVRRWQLTGKLVWQSRRPHIGRWFLYSQGSSLAQHSPTKLLRSWAQLEKIRVQLVLGPINWPLHA